MIDQQKPVKGSARFEDYKHDSKPTKVDILEALETETPSVCHHATCIKKADREEHMDQTNAMR